MALQSEIEYNGLSSAVGYWKTNEMSWRAEEPFTVRCRIDGYASKQAYLNGLPAIASEDLLIELPGDPESPEIQLFNQIRALIYEKAKALPRFEGAIDC